MDNIQEISVSGTMDAATAGKIAVIVFGRGNFEQSDVQVSQTTKKVIFRRKREGANEGRKA